MHKKDHTPRSSRICSRLQGLDNNYKSINVIHHINKMKEKKTWSNATEAGKVFDKIHTHLSIYLFIYNYLIVVQLQLSAFSPLPPTPPQTNPPPSPASKIYK